jgi:hypothetical protein
VVVTERAVLLRVADRLQALAADLGRRGFSVRLVLTSGRLRLWVENRSVPQLSEVVYAAPADDGAWWLWWSWADRLASIEDVDDAAVRIAHVLTADA